MEAAVTRTRSRRLKGATHVDATDRDAGATGDGGITAGGSARTAVGGGAVTGAPFRSDLVAVTCGPRDQSRRMFRL